MNKYNKESYITARPNPLEWKNHVNVKTLEDFSEFIQGDVLDIGCNHGATTYWLKNFNIQSITGVDLNSAALDVAKDTLSKIGIPNNLIVQNYVDSSIGNEFDTIISFHTLEHIFPEDANSFVKNIYADLKKGGYFIIGIPYDKAYPDSCHVAFYTEITLSNLLESVGFKTIKCFANH
jgi:2-polyprenyl-3-methyl-5-hydroxy-6-metoxy-1,4-benzoquinol methylase